MFRLRHGQEHFVLLAASIRGAEPRDHTLMICPTVFQAIRIVDDTYGRSLTCAKYAT
jgi:hypothetical protein